MANSMTCIDMEVIPGCHVTAAGVATPISIHYEYGLNATGNVIIVATRYTNAAGVPFAPAGTDTIRPGQCPCIKTDVELLLLCDDVDNNPATPGVPFMRRIERLYNCDTGALVSQSAANFQLDGVTAYTVVGTVGTECLSDFEFEENVVCDSLGVAHIRRTSIVNGVSTTVGYFNPTTNAASVPTGAIGPCPNCVGATALGVVSTWG